MHGNNNSALKCSRANEGNTWIMGNVCCGGKFGVGGKGIQFTK